MINEKPPERKHLTYNPNKDLGVGESKGKGPADRTMDSLGIVGGNNAAADKKEKDAAGSIPPKKDEIPAADQVAELQRQILGTGKLVDGIISGAIQTESGALDGEPIEVELIPGIFDTAAIKDKLSRGDFDFSRFENLSLEDLKLIVQASNEAAKLLDISGTLKVDLSGLKSLSAEQVEVLNLTNTIKLLFILEGVSKVDDDAFSLSKKLIFCQVVFDFQKIGRSMKAFSKGKSNTIDGLMLKFTNIDVYTKQFHDTLPKFGLKKAHFLARDIGEGISCDNIKSGHVYLTKGDNGAELFFGKVDPHAKNDLLNMSNACRSADLPGKTDRVFVVNTGDEIANLPMNALEVLQQKNFRDVSVLAKSIDKKSLENIASTNLHLEIELKYLTVEAAEVIGRMPQPVFISLEQYSPRVVEALRKKPGVLSTSTDKVKNGEAEKRILENLLQRKGILGMDFCFDCDDAAYARHEGELYILVPTLKSDNGQKFVDEKIAKIKEIHKNGDVSVEVKK